MRKKAASTTNEQTIWLGYTPIYGQCEDVLHTVPSNRTWENTSRTWIRDWVEAQNRVWEHSRQQMLARIGQSFERHNHSLPPNLLFLFYLKGEKNCDVLAGFESPQFGVDHPPAPEDRPFGQMVVVLFCVCVCVCGLVWIVRLSIATCLRNVYWFSYCKCTQQSKLTNE